MQLISKSYENISTSVLLRGQEVKIHALCTGVVSVKENFKTKKGSSSLASLNILFGKKFTNYLPIWVWVIEHPDGVIVIDTGEIESVKNLNIHLKNESRFDRYAFGIVTKFEIDKEDEIENQLKTINLKSEDVKLVILTHLHLDHTDGLKFFPKAEIIVSDLEYKNPSTNMPSTYPVWFKPNRVIYSPNKIEIFDDAYTINKDLYYVPSPGHTIGHSSIIFKTDEYDIIFAGDASYSQDQVLNGQLAGANTNFKKAKETYNNILSYALKRKTIYLPTHDENAALRLKDKLFII